MCVRALAKRQQTPIPYQLNTITPDMTGVLVVQETSNVELWLANIAAILPYDTNNGNTFLCKDVEKCSRLCAHYMHVNVLANISCTTATFFTLFRQC